MKTVHRRLDIFKRKNAPQATLEKQNELLQVGVFESVLMGTLSY